MLIYTLEKAEISQIILKDYFRKLQTPYRDY